jgi:cytochrome c553
MLVIASKLDDRDSAAIAAYYQQIAATRINASKQGTR